MNAFQGLRQLRSPSVIPFAGTARDGAKSDAADEPCSSHTAEPLQPVGTPVAPEAPPVGSLRTVVCHWGTYLLFAALALWMRMPICMAQEAQRPSVAFFYGAHPPASVLRDFDWVIVQPEALAQPKALAGPRTTVFAYVSLGEITMDSPAAQTLPPHCRLAENRIWKSWIVNQANPECRAYYLQHVFAPLRARGYRNYFFDTLDSYRLALKSATQRAAYRAGLVALIESVHRHDPQGRFIFNRGFALLPALKDQGVIAVAAESLYRGWDQSTRRYLAVDPTTTRALLAQLERVRQRGLTPIAIDYLPAAERTEAQHVAHRIERHGIVPYVTNASLDIVGVSTITPVPRQVLMLYAGRGDAMNNDLNWYAAMPLNHLGYATRTLNVTRSALPSGPLTGQVAGIVTWFHSSQFGHSARTWRWLRMQMKAGVPVAILGHFGLPLSSGHLGALGLRLGKAAPAGLHRARLAHLDSRFFGFESPALPSAPDYSPIRLSPPGRPLLAVTVAGGTEVAAALTPWGGYVLSPYVLRSLPQGNLANGALQAAWIVDPFRFLRAALRLPPVPAYDYTTSSGRRLLFGLIDGDGFTSLSWIGAFHDQPAAEVILDQVLKRFRLPVTASVIASEFIRHGLHPEAQVATLRPIARQIFRLPWVQIGTHTYSHPFDWQALERDPDLSAGLHPQHSAAAAAGNPAFKYGMNLPVPGYRFSPEMEVTGSAAIIERLLAPPGKPVRVIQWSGDTDPDAKVLAIAYRGGLENINGNNSTITRAHPSLTNVVPLGVRKGKYFQVYSPIGNEDEFTHGWKPPYCGYSQVIQTLEMTDRPRRLTAMELYYHYYAGTRACALKQLEQVYRWAERQPSTPVFASTYSRIAVAFQSAGLALAGRGFLLRGYGPDQELRIPAALGYPDLADSRNVAGYRDVGTNRYVHLGPGGDARLVLQPTAPRGPYLKSANGLIEALARAPGRLELQLQGYVPLSITLGNAAHCVTRINGRVRHRRADARGEVHFQLTAERARLAVRCRG